MVNLGTEGMVRHGSCIGKLTGLILCVNLTELWIVQDVLARCVLLDETNVRTSKLDDAERPPQYG